jgi:hypothetical protein
MQQYAWLIARWVTIWAPLSLGEVNVRRRLAFRMEGKTTITKNLKLDFTNVFSSFRRPVNLTS